MKALRDRILRDGKILPGGILKVDAFLNHQLDPELTREMGLAFHAAFVEQGVGAVDKVFTAEVSGIAPALAVGLAYGAPVVYARKKRPVTMGPEAITASAPSHTKGGTTPLIVSTDYLRPGEGVLVIDDFLASGRTVLALTTLVARAGARLLGIGCVIEKSFERGREPLRGLGVPIVALAVVASLDDGIVLAG